MKSLFSFLLFAAIMSVIALTAVRHGTAPAVGIAFLMGGSFSPALQSPLCGLKAFALTTNEQAATGYTTLIILGEADLTQTTANTAQAITGITLRVGDVIGPKLGVKLVTPFQDSGDNALNTTTLSVGDSGSATRFLGATQLNANGTPVRFAVGTGTQKAYTAADTLLFTFGSMSGKNLAALNAGEVHVYLQICNLNDFVPAIS